MVLKMEYLGTNENEEIMELQKLEKIKGSCFSNFWPLGGDIDSFEHSTYLAEI